MGIAGYIKEIGRGRDGARALNRDQAADLMGQVLDGAVTDPENRLSMREGLILRLKRWKSMGSG